MNKCKECGVCYSCKIHLAKAKYENQCVEAAYAGSFVIPPDLNDFDWEYNTTKTNDDILADVELSYKNPRYGLNQLHLLSQLPPNTEQTIFSPNEHVDNTRNEESVTNLYQSGGRDDATNRTADRDDVAPPTTYQNSIKTQSSEGSETILDYSQSIDLSQDGGNHPNTSTSNTNNQTSSLVTPNRVSNAGRQMETNHILVSEGRIEVQYVDLSSPLLTVTRPQLPELYTEVQRGGKCCDCGFKGVHCRRLVLGSFCIAVVYRYFKTSPATYCVHEARKWFILAYAIVSDFRFFCKHSNDSIPDVRLLEIPKCH